jgi:NAD(P)H-nitrite reductase large subunit
LLIATGGKPLLPRIRSLGSEGVFAFTRLDDANRIKSYISGNSVREAVVLGAGLIGLKAAEGLAELGIKTTIVEMADRVLSAVFDKRASTIVQSALKKAGCRLLLKNTVTGVKRQGGRIRSALLKDTK